MSGAAAAGSVLAVSTALMAVVAVRRVALPLAASLSIAFVTRVLFAAVTSQTYTPNDTRTYFRRTGELFLQGQDMFQEMPARQWNFLPLMPAVHAVEIKTGLPWVYAVKVAPILADVVLVWLVARLASEDGLSRALQYALNPVSLLVVSLHGQVEPVALAFAVAGILLAERSRWGAAGLLIGTAIAAKTWPVLIAVAVLPFGKRAVVPRYVGGLMVVPLLSLSVGVLFLGTDPLDALRQIASYSSFVRRWTWSGTLVEAGRIHSFGYDTSVGRIGGAVTLLAVVAALVVFRRQSPAGRAMVVLCLALVVTAGFGVQYLMWPLPLMFAVAHDRRLEYTVAAAAWAACFYIVSLLSKEAFLVGLSWLVVTCLVRVVSGAWNPTRAITDAAQEPPVPDVRGRAAAPPGQGELRMS